MDFAAEVCDSCGDQFCKNCLVYPRGTNKPPLCTNCAMGLSGVRNRRPVKPLGRAEIKKRRKRLKAELADQDTSVVDTNLPGSVLIEVPDIEPEEPEESAPAEQVGFMGRFRRRKTDHVPDEEAVSPEPPTPEVTILGGGDQTEETALVPPPDGEGQESVPAPPEHSSAAAILEQLREQEAGGDEDDVWLPPAGGDTTTWTLPDISQSPLGGAGPWESVASSPTPAVDQGPPENMSDFAPPAFVSEAELRSQGKADTDNSGNWVPPTLRGMAPQAGSNGKELPRRRRQQPQDS
jgi:hypothetical protein